MKKKFVVLSVLLAMALLVFCGNVYAADGEDYGSLDVNDSVVLVMDVHETKQLDVVIRDKSYNVVEVDNSDIIYESSDEKVVKVDDNGKLQAVGAGTATVLTEAAGVEGTTEVTVYAAPQFTDFSNAKYDVVYGRGDVTVEITGVTVNKDSNYYYMVTKDENPPKITYYSDGNIDVNSMDYGKKFITKSSTDGVFGTLGIEEYFELNQDIYLWVFERVTLENYYEDENGKTTGYADKLLVKAEKLERPTLKLNDIIKTASTQHDSQLGDDTLIQIKSPIYDTSRKFEVKIGKVTDSSILNKIKNADYTGITELLTYSKNNSSIYDKTLTVSQSTSGRAYCGVNLDETLFDKSLLEDGAYYYMYIKFDDENGKYYPIEGITLGQAGFNDDGNWWLSDMNADKFSWSNVPADVTSNTEQTAKTEETNKTEQTAKTDELIIKTEETNTTNTTKTDATKSQEKTLPHTGSSVALIIVLSASAIVIGIVTYKKYKYLNF